MTKWHEVHDSRVKKPETLDKFSSQVAVYERRNIRQETRNVQSNGTPSEVTEWVYEQREYTQEEYATTESPSTQMIMQTLSDIELSVAELGLNM